MLMKPMMMFTFHGVLLRFYLAWTQIKKHGCTWVCLVNTEIYMAASYRL
jgi:hypothetical protein